MTDEYFMRLALRLARRAGQKGEIPVGCVIVRDGRILARAANDVESRRDVTRHAELVALSKAARKLNNWRLSRCTVFVTKEPCPMCAGALALARVQRIVFGAPDPAMGGCGGRFNLVADGAMRARIPVTGGLLADECRQVLQEFFRSVRSRPKPRPQT